MPFAPVDNNGTVLFYEDSGAPDATEEYTTLVLFHGIMYTNGIFAKLLPFAARHHVRLIRVNQRDYPPSSLFTPLELEEFSSRDKNAQARCLANRGIEVANLLVHLIDTLKLPPISANNDAKAVGGISVLGWSMGTHLPFALLSNASALLPQIQQQLQHYLRSTLIFDPSIFPVGEPIPPIAFAPNRPKGIYWPSFDEGISDKERQRRFDVWISSYYTPIEDISEVTLEILGERLAVQDLPEDAFRVLKIEEWTKVITLERFIPDELVALSSPESMSRFFVTLGKLDNSVHKKSFRRALGLGDSPADISRDPLIWPECKVVLVWCDMTLVDCTIASSVVVKLLNEERSNVRRKVEIEKLPGANHFPHWDEPERVMAFLAGQI